MSLLLPVCAFNRLFFELNLKTKFLVSIILNSKSKIGNNKGPDTCKHFNKKDFYVFSLEISVCYLIGKNIIRRKLLLTKALTRRDPVFKNSDFLVKFLKNRKLNKISLEQVLVFLVFHVIIMM